MSAASFFLPELSVYFSPSPSCLQWQLVIAGGRNPAKSWLTEVAGNLEVYCADKGIEAALEAGIVPKVLLGDGDSAPELSYVNAANLGVEVKRFPREKDDTDLQLLLSNIEQKNLCITGIWGGRFDHLYSNVFSLLSWTKKNNCKVIMADEKEVMMLLNCGDKLELEFKDNFRPKALSLLSLSNKATVDFYGVHWPLEKAELDYLKPYAISNEAVKDKINCCCYSGDIGLYICLEE